MNDPSQMQREPRFGAPFSIKYSQIVISRLDIPGNSGRRMGT